MNISNGDYAKSNKLINRMDYMDEKNNKVSITLKEEKLLEYFFYSLQKRHIIRKEIKKEDFFWTSKGVFHFSLNEEESRTEHLFLKTEEGNVSFVDFEMDVRHLKKFMRVEEGNYIQDLEEVLGKLFTKKVVYIRTTKDSIENRNVSPIKNFVIKKMNVEKKYRCNVSIDVEFLYLAIFQNGQFTPLNINIVKNLRSKYSLRIYQEIEKALSLRHENLTLRSLKSMNDFFGTTHIIKSKMDQIILRTKQELLLNKMYSFKYEVYQNDSKEWVFKITDIIKLSENDIIFDYIYNYLDFRLLTPEMQEVFKLEYSNDYLEMMDIDSKEIKTATSRTTHIQRKQN